jgi:hypothetical protein
MASVKSFIKVKIHYHVHRGPQLHRALSHLNYLRTPIFYVFKAKVFPLLN